MTGSEGQKAHSIGSIVEILDDEDNTNEEDICIMKESKMEVIELSASMSNKTSVVGSNMRDTSNFPSSPISKEHNLNLHDDAGFSSSDISLSIIPDRPNTANNGITKIDTETPTGSQIARKRILDDIMNQNDDMDSSRSDHIINENSMTSETANNKWRKWSKTITDLANNRTTKMESKQISEANSINIIDSQEMSSQSRNPSQNVLDIFPMSSPVIEKSSIGKPHRINDDIIKETGSTTIFSNSVNNANTRLSTSSLSFSQKDKKKKVRLTIAKKDIHNGPDKNTVDINIPVFLDDDFDLVNELSDEDHKLNESLTARPFSEPDISHNTTDTADTIFASQRPNSNNNLMLNERLPNSQQDRLADFIVNGRFFNDKEAKDLVTQSLKHNKESFRRVNQKIIDPEKARSEIIIEMTNQLYSEFCSTGIDLESHLSPAQVQTGYITEVPLIKFLRKCDSVYDFSHDYYFPTERRIIEENTILLYYEAKEFFKQYTTNKKDLYRLIRSYSKRGKHVILILNEVNKLKADISNLENYIFQKKVNTELNKLDSQFSRPRSKRMQEIESLGIRSFDLEQRLRFIDRHWHVQVHTVTSSLEFINSLPNLISLIGKQRIDPALRYMKYAHINVRSGKNKTDILKKTLHEIGRLPELKATAVTQAYSSLQELLHDFEKGQLKTSADGKHLMSEAMEKRLYKLLMTKDPKATIE